MKTFNRASLPEEIRYNGKVYKYAAKQGTRSIRVLVMATRLRGRLDLHGKPYQPNEFFFDPDNQNT